MQWGTNKITGLGTPTDAADATTKAYTDSILGSATSAADSAAAAATSASNAATSASNAASSATTASNAVTSAELAATNAAASYDSFDDRYLGAKASDPTLDNDGDALIAGATYFNTSTDSMKVYSGSAWSDVAPVATTVTLSQVTDFPTQSGQSGKYLSTNGTTPTWETLTTDPTLGTLTKTFTAGESSTIDLTSSVLAPVVSVTKEVPQSGVTNNNWDVNSTTENYTRLNSAYGTTLDFNALGVNVSSYVGVATTLSEATSLFGFRLSTDGTKMFVTSSETDSVYQYSLSTAYDVSTASYDSVSFLVASQEINPTGLAFNNDGTKMFIVGFSSNTVYEYTLSTGFALSTASYSQSFSVSTQANFATSLDFNDDGTKMYILNYIGNMVYQYSLSTGFDVSTASYDSIAQNVSGTANYSLTWSNGGKTLTTVSTGNNYINQRAYSTPYDLSTYTGGSSLLVSGTLTDESGIVFTGSKFYLLANDGTIHEYSLPQQLALGTGSFASADVGKTIEANDGAFVLTATDGSIVETTAPTSYDQVASGSWEMYGVVYNAADGDLELSGYSNTFNITDASYDSVSFSVSSQMSNCYGVRFSSDGTKMYVAEATREINQYNLSTPFVVSSASYSSTYTVAEGSSVYFDFCFNNDGTVLYAVGYSNQTIYQYTLSTPWSISTASYSGKSYAATFSSGSSSINISADGTKMFLGRVGTFVAIHEIDLSTAYDVSTASYSSVEFRPTGIGSVYSYAFNKEGTKLFALSINDQAIYQYSLGTAFSITSVTDDSISFSLSSSSIYYFCFNILIGH